LDDNRCSKDTTAITGSKDTDVLNIPRMAVDYGAVYIEKHLDAVGKDTPDRKHSLNQREFKLMVEAINGDLPEPRFAWTPEEQEIALKHRRRIIAIADLYPGDMLKRGVNFGVYRSKESDTHGAHAFQVYSFDNRRVKTRLKPFQGICLTDVE